MYGVMWRGHETGHIGCDSGRGRRDAAAVVAGDFASSNAGVLLAHRGESCRPGVVSIEPDMGDAVRFFKASGSEAEGLG